MSRACDSHIEIWTTAGRMDDQRGYPSYDSPA
jgi:hypothetical protein